MIETIDHLVLTARDLETTCAFYVGVLGFERRDAPGRPTALHFGTHKINVHQAGREFEPKAASPTPGAADFCLIADRPIDDVIAHIGACGVAIEAGPVARTGARGAMTSVYLRDPDGTLIEIARYDG